MSRYIRKNNINIIAQKNRGEDKNNKPSSPPKPQKKIKFDIKKKKQNTINSLFEVEHFLSNFKKFGKYAKLYLLLK